MDQKSAVSPIAQPALGAIARSPSASTIKKTMAATTIISWILQGGVILSSAFIVLGLCLLPTRPGGLSVHRVLTFPRSTTEVWAGVLVLRPQSFIVIGLILLIATPVIRVAFSVIAFTFERDYRYIVITLIVLAILVLSFLLGKGGI